jgi:hypothetical protein
VAEDDKTVDLKNKISELRQRLNRIYAQYFTDTDKSRVFEAEFSLYLKACDHARHDIAENRSLEYDITKKGLVVLIAAYVASIYLINVNAFFGAVILLGFGFLACGFMYLLSAAEIRIARASEFCTELETYFQRHRWSTELKEGLNLPEMPLWGEFEGKWDKDMFHEGHFEKKALYGPFRISITLIAISSLFYLIQAFVSQGFKLTYPVLVLCLILWSAVVILQVLIVHTIVNTVDTKLARSEDRPEELTWKKITWQPSTWTNLLRLFLVLDILFPKPLKKV